MAEIFIITRGHADHVDKWERSMRNIWLPITTKKKVRDKDGVEMEIMQDIPVDVQLRPYQLWGVVVPDEKFVQPLCNSLGIPHEQTWFDKKPGEQTGSFISGIGVKAQMEAMRLALGAEKLPVQDPTKPREVLTQPIYKEHVNILGLGWRPDEKIKTALGEHEGM